MTALPGYQSVVSRGGSVTTLSMEHSNLVRLTDRAWDEYRTLAMGMVNSPALAGDLAYCTKTARAYNEWQRLFLASEGDL